MFNVINEIDFMLQKEIMEKKRLDWETMFCLIVKVLSYRSSCAKTKQAAIIVKDNRILSAGYNGPISGGINCVLEGGEDVCGKDYNFSCKNGIHAEANAIGFLNRYGSGIGTEGCSIYITQYPCLMCAKLIVASGIKKVIMIEKYRINEGLNYLLDNGIECVDLSKTNNY